MELSKETQAEIASEEAHKKLSTLDRNSPEYDAALKDCLEKIRQHHAIRRKNVLRDQAENGFVQVVNGGITCRLGNELSEKQFHETLGYGWPPKPPAP